MRMRVLMSVRVRVVVLEEADDRLFKLAELRGEIDRRIAAGDILNNDRVLFKDATRLWHEAPHRYGRSLGVRFIGTHELGEALERLRNNAQVKIDDWDTAYA